MTLKHLPNLALFTFARHSTRHLDIKGQVWQKQFWIADDGHEVDYMVQAEKTKRGWKRGQGGSSVDSSLNRKVIPLVYRKKKLRR